MLKAGKYYVGDLCYLLDQGSWKWREVLNATGFLGLYEPGTERRIPFDERQGYFHHKGVKFFCSETAYGDGRYKDQQGREYPVDAGLIGCFPLAALPESAVTDGGHVIDFPSDFRCAICDAAGKIQIGTVIIETDPIAEWDEDEDEDE